MPGAVEPGYGRVTGVLLPCAEDRRRVQEVAPVDKLSVLLVSVFAVAFLGERPSLREWTGIAMVGAGVFVLAFKR